MSPQASKPMPWAFNVASVFHMILVLEWGLSAFAAALHVRYTHTGWNDIIDKIEAAVAVHTKAKQTPSLTPGVA